MRIRVIRRGVIKRKTGHLRGIFPPLYHAVQIYAAVRQDTEHFEDCQTLMA